MSRAPSPEILERRAAARLRLEASRQALADALLAKKLRMREFAEECSRERQAVRDALAGLKRNALAALRHESKVARDLARDKRNARLEEARRLLGSRVDAARVALRTRQQHAEEQSRIAAQEQRRRAELEALHTQTLAGGVLHGSKLEKLRPLLERARSITPAPGESRVEALWRYAQEHPEEMLAVLEPQTEARVAGARAEVAAARDAARTPHPYEKPRAASKPRRTPGRSRSVQQGLSLDAPLLHRASKPTMSASSSPPANTAPAVKTTGQTKIAPASKREVSVQPAPPTPAKPAAVDAPAAAHASNAYEQKRAARVDRLRERAAKKKAEAEGAFRREHEIGSRIPFGQPVLTGHHSAKRHRRDLEKMRGLASKGVAMSKAADALERRAAAAESNTSISSDDPEALTKLRQKADALAKQRERMRRANATIRKGGPDVVKQLVGDGFSENAAKTLLEKDALGRRGFPDFKLTNTAAEERRVRARIGQLEAQAARPPSAPEVVGEVTIAEAENRVRVSFPSKPSEEVRTALKRAGFRWTPTVGAWQRFAGTGARNEARRIAAMVQATPPGLERAEVPV